MKDNGTELLVDDGFTTSVRKIEFYKNLPFIALKREKTWETFTVHVHRPMNIMNICEQLIINHLH